MKQLPLKLKGDICANRHKGNEESKQAHEKTLRSKARDIKTILEFIATRGIYGATCEEIERGTGISHQTASARISELVRDMQVQRIGKRKTSTGCNASVLVFTRL